MDDTTAPLNRGFFNQGFDGLVDSDSPPPHAMTTPDVTADAISVHNGSSPNLVPQGLSIKRTTSYGALFQSPTAPRPNAPASAGPACDSRAPIPPNNQNVDNWLEHTDTSDPGWPLPRLEKESWIVTNVFADVENSSSNHSACPPSAVPSSDLVPNESASHRKMTQSSGAEFLLAEKYSENRLEDDPTSRELGLDVTPD